MDEIVVDELEVLARVGVSEAERAVPQRLTLTMHLWPVEPFESLHDDISNATDYAAVCATARDLVAQRSDRLIETLALELATKLLEEFALKKVRVELRKFVLTDAKYTAVIVTRTARRGS
jgi:dihydroneopterin aldolase